MALRVARQLVMYLKRPSGQSQFSVPLEPVSTTRRIEDLRHHIMRNIAEKLSVADLAAHVHVSERQLTRIFKTELGMTPSAYIESARVETARRQLESAQGTLERIASNCGFGTTDTLIRAFRRKLNTTPTGIDVDSEPAPAVGDESTVRLQERLADAGRARRAGISRRGGRDELRDRIGEQVCTKGLRQGRR